MPRSGKPVQLFPIRLTQAQRRVVARIAPEMADRLKLAEDNQRSIPFTRAELISRPSRSISRNAASVIPKRRVIRLRACSALNSYKSCSSTSAW
jgi:hypothetical protein